MEREMDAGIAARMREEFGFWFQTCTFLEGKGMEMKIHHLKAARDDRSRASAKISSVQLAGSCAGMRVRITSEDD